MKKLCPTQVLALLILITAGDSSLTHAADKSEIWVYTSIYKEFIAPIQKAFEAKHPDVSVQVYQGGSEKIQAKIEAELIASKPQADILLTSDPFWSSTLQKRGLIQERAGHPAIETNYYSLMVLVCHKDLPTSARPVSFTELTDPRFKNLVQAGSPLESGTAFTTVAYLSKKLGWDYFARLRQNGLASSGGNSTVIQKVESGEKKIGIVLLENALAARKRGSPIEIIYPRDGSIPIPSVQVVLKGSKNEKAVEEFADFVLSHEGQELIRNGYMYSVRRDVAPPEGAEALSKVTQGTTPWTPALIESVSAESKAIKKKFSETVLE